MKSPMEHEIDRETGTVAVPIARIASEFGK